VIGIRALGIRALGGWALGALIGAVVVGCASGNGPGAESGTGADTLVYGAGGQPVNLDAGNATDGNSIVVQEQIYDGLLSHKPGTTEVAPALAMQWSVSPDRKTWTFKLRPGVTFHDGTPLTAAAVKFNLERWWNPAHPQGFRTAGKTYEAWQQLFGGFKGDAESLVQAIRTPDAMTVQIVLKQPFAAFPNAVGSSFFGMASPAAVQKAGAAYGTAGSIAVGTGPFRFQEWRTGDRIVLTKNPKYWQPDRPKVAQLVIRFITDPAARLAQLRAGQVDFTVDLAPDQRQELARDANLQVIARPSFNVGFLGLNPTYKPLADVRVRQAIALAINRPQLVQSFWGDLGTHNPHFLPPALGWALSPKLAPHPFDPAKAQQLLAAAGYAQGFDLDLWYMPVSRPYYPTPKPIAEAFAADLSAVGIRVQLKTKDWAAYLADRNKLPGFPAFMLGWTGDYGDPDSFLYVHYGPGGTQDIGNWQGTTPQEKSDRQRLIQLLNQARAEGVQAKRAALYHQVDEIQHRLVLRVPIVHAQPLLAQRKTLSGWVPSPLGTEPFDTISKSK
jgi:peptide/nickel transport system substrate-binding protein